MNERLEFESLRSVCGRTETAGPVDFRQKSGQTRLEQRRLARTKQR